MPHPSTPDPTSSHPGAPDPSATRAIAEEQSELERAEDRRRQLLDELSAAVAGTAPREATELARRSILRRRRAELIRAEDGLIFGRLDTVDGATRRIGRIGIPDADGEPIVLDWRAPAARAFYTATPLDPQGLTRRRHIRTQGTDVLAVDDELLDGAADADLVGEGALLAALAERRTGRMASAVATLQREQDAIVRAEADVPLVVQGGPGTGKTVVALHRVAYLLFAHPELAARGVLLLGPSRRFLDYIEQVLPALGETAVVAATCESLVPGARPEREESRELAEIKGRPLWRDALARHVDDLVPVAADLTVPFDDEQYVLPQAQVARLLRSARSGRSYDAARRVVRTLVADSLADAVAERNVALLAQMEDGFEDVLSRLDTTLARTDDRAVPTGERGTAIDGVLSDDDLDDLRDRIGADTGVRAALGRWWPRLEPARVLDEVLRGEDRLADLAPALTADERRAVASEQAGWANSDIALLDAVAELLGTDVGDSTTGTEETDTGTGAGTDTGTGVGTDASPDRGEFLADRARSQRSWTYGHVVVDEAQELSAMQWLMVLRRCPARSITAVGDIDQADAPHRHTDWDEAVRHVAGDHWRRADLTICYRTPSEVMELVGPVLRQAGSTNAPPRAVRTTGRVPQRTTVGGADLGDAVAHRAQMLATRYAGGTVGVIAPAVRVTALRSGVPAGVPVLTAVEAKGLEWDAAIVVDPEGITAEPRGWNRLYVALTRCTQELALLDVTPPT